MLGYFCGVAAGHCKTTKGQKTPKKGEKGQLDRETQYWQTKS